MSGMWDSECCRQGARLRKFGSKRLHWAPRQGAWHGDCYRQKETDRFPIQSTKEQEEVDFEEEEGTAEEEDLFRVGRDGDHLLCSFQCNLCHFQNIQQRLELGQVGQSEATLKW
jgi:hypothetical protein